MSQGKKSGAVIWLRGPLLHNLLRPNILTLAVMTICVLLFWAAGQVFDFPVYLSLQAGIAMFILAISSALISLCIACFVTLAWNRPDRPLAFIFTKLAYDWKITDRFMRGLPICLCIPVLLSVFLSYKRAISQIVPFYADPYALVLDRMIHGTDPWRLLHLIFGFPLATAVIDFVYTLWFLVIFIVLSLVIFVLGNERLRSQYLVASALCWSLIGGLSATLLSSAGPCYYPTFYAGDPYADLFAYLAQAREVYPLWALDTQERLLSAYERGGMVFGEGISALPSMHVAIAVLNGIFLSHINRYACWAAWIFAAAIFIGSVHLGWHYAVDGYVAALLVIIIWFGAGKLTDLFEPREQIRLR